MGFQGVLLLFIRVHRTVLILFFSLWKRIVVFYTAENKGVHRPSWV